MCLIWLILVTNKFHEGYDCFFVFIYLMYYLNDSQGAISCNEKAFSCTRFNKIKYCKCNADAGKNDRENIFFIIILYYFKRQRID